MAVAPATRLPNSYANVSTTRMYDKRKNRSDGGLSFKAEY